jgi:L-histidine N-alpha-methyltransferase
MVISTKTLQASICQVTEHALDCGALERIPTTYQFLAENNINFIVRILANLIKKDLAKSQEKAKVKSDPNFNPFLPYEEDLFVADISPSHLCLLNKYNAVDHHILIITRDFAEQESLIDLSDFQAMWVCLQEIDGLAFYNSGKTAGASQRHKHLQMVPLPLINDPECRYRLPMEPAIQAAVFADDGIGVSPDLPFPHAIAQLPSWGEGKNCDELGAITLELYLKLLERLNIIVRSDGKPNSAYNLLATREWLLIVPRANGSYQGISVNALGFAGALLVRNQAELEILESIGPLTLLTNVASSHRPHYRLEYLIDHDDQSQKLDLGKDVIAGLTQSVKTLPPKYFYDELGSKLFEEICLLPEYYPTRTERGILLKYASAIAEITGPCEIVELGSGSSTKTRILLDAYEQSDLPLRYLPIDISGEMLKNSALGLLKDYPNLQVHGLVGTYEVCLQHLGKSPVSTRMICFLGSTLGNLNPAESKIFFHEIKQALQVGEYFLLGVDLHKSKDVLEPAYNDQQGVTAQFNLNMLANLNNLFEADFDLTQFNHRAFYNETAQQIEMHLVSGRSQTVNLKSLHLNIELEAGETIMTEISRKFHLPTLQKELEAENLITRQIWTDEKQWFALLLCQLQ